MKSLWRHLLIQHGAKVAYTAQIKGTHSDLVPGEQVGKRIVGYLGHDGKTGIGALFTTVSVVCANTLSLATARASELKCLTHKGGANADVTQLPSPNPFGGQIRCDDYPVWGFGFH